MLSSEVWQHFPEWCCYRSSGTRACDSLVAAGPVRSSIKALLALALNKVQC